MPSLPVIVFIPHCGTPCKPGGEDPPDNQWLPRRCPACDREAIIGHGRRRRQAHDGSHDWIRVRRGICKACGGTLTVLPAGCVPGAPYSLPVRQQALALLAQGRSAEQAAPHCRDSERLADASTIRRWVQRRLESLPWFFWPPTLLAWDWRAAGRILGLEAFPP